MAPTDVSKKPADTAFKQQRLPAWKPVLTPFWVMVVFFLIGIPFIIIGTTMRAKSSELEELRIQYDGQGTSSSYSDCRISESDEHATCTVTFTAEEKMKAPVYVYYQLTNYYQNHRRYVKSYSQEQLLGCTGSSSSGCSGYTLSDCEPLRKNGSLTLSPCGLIANSLFNDKILLSSGQDISYHNTAWNSDGQKFNQPDGFKKVKDNTNGPSCYTGGNYAECSDLLCTNAFGAGHSGCKAFLCSEPEYHNCDSGDYYMFYYPKDSSTQYLYETFPEVVSPIHGVETDRFQVWMRTAALPKFRKLYAKIDDDIEKGETVSFDIIANFDVSSFKGTKALIIATTSWFGTKNAFLGNAFIAVGTISLAVGVMFAIKQIVSPRQLGDISVL